MKFINKLALCLIAICSFSTAKSLNNYHAYALSDEQVSVVQWVMKKSEVKLEVDKAKSIVRNVYEYAAFHKTDPLLLLAIMRTESGFREKAVSNYGAVGLMQVVPRWHEKKLRDRDPTNPVVSIEVGSQILTDCFKRYSGNKEKALNCYSGNGGAKYLAKVNMYQDSLKESVVFNQYKTLYAYAF